MANKIEACLQICADWGLIPTEFRQCMTWEEQVLWLGRFLQTVIVPTTNQMIEDFEALKTWVENYLDSQNFQEMVNAKLDEMAEDGTLADLINQEIFGELNEKVDALDETKLTTYRFNTLTPFEDIQAAFADTKPKLIQFSKGTYTLTDRIDINSDTTIDLGGATLNSSYADQYNNNQAFMCIATATTTGYNGVHDVKIMNGKVNTAMSFMHARNVLLENIDFAQGIDSHALQIAGCKNVEIRDCIFRGVSISASGYNHELIQLETANHDAQPYFPVGSDCFDHTGNEDIRIIGNDFKDGDGTTTLNYVSIGHHDEDASNLYSQYNILIAKNNFETSHYWDISLPGMYHSIIEDNTFWQGSTVSGHIAINLRGHQKFVTIRNNTISSGTGGITASGAIQRENIEISGNVINATQESGCIAINLRNAKDLYVHDNNLTSSGRAMYSAIDGDDMVNQNHQIYNNYINVNASSDGGIQMASAGSSKVYVANNVIEQQDQTQPFLRLPTSPDLTYANNVIKNNSSATSVKAISTIDNYSNVYGVGVELYTAGASYAAISGGALAKSALQFNTILLVLHNGGNTNGGITVFKIKSFTPNAKLDARKYAVLTNNGWSDATSYGQFEIVSGGTTFNWTSGSSLILRKVIGYNEQLV